MKKMWLLLMVLLFSSAIVRGKTYEVMLQGFHWDSHQYDWYQILSDNSQRIKDSGFTIVWFPPPSQSTGTRPQGYEPTELYSLDSAYGPGYKLSQAISAMHNGTYVKVLADIVVNHRSGSTDWADFSNPAWSTYTICSDDEWWGPKSQNADTGDQAGFARDLDHLNPETQNGVKDWMHWLRWTIGFDGWRYDMVKGYASWAVGMYNDHTSPSFSVGENLDYDAGYVVGWIDGTHQNWWQRSTAFDFPNRNVLWNAVVHGNYHWLKYGDKAPGVIGVWSDKAVTFIENHDTEEVRGGAYAPAFPNDSRMLQGYAYILSHPGTPCVFWRDIYDYGSYNEGAIRDMIWLRKHYGIHSESTVWIANANYGDSYAAYIQGDNGEIAVKIGPGSWAPSGWKWSQGNELILSGTDFAIWGEHGKWW